MPKRPSRKTVETLTHGDSSRKNIPTAEFRSVMDRSEQSPVQLAYQRRNRDLDPQLVWRGKDAQDRSDLVVQAPPLFIQEKVHPKVLVDDLRRQRGSGQAGQGDESAEVQPDLFADFNGLPSDDARTEFYQHDANWSNRMILGDSLQVMASLAEREGLRGKRDRLVVARDLLAESGSIFVQIGDENVHRVRVVLDEVFGDENFVSLILFRKTGGLTANFIPTIGDYLLWYSRNKSTAKFRRAFKKKRPGDPGATQYRYELREDGRLKDLPDPVDAMRSGVDLCAHADLTSQGNALYEFRFAGQRFRGGFKPSPGNISRLGRAGRLYVSGRSLRYIRRLSDHSVYELNHLWEDVGISGFDDPRLYVVQTLPKVIERCMLMTTDPGDLVLDPTCGSGTTAYVAEQWGRRWITIDTSRVALALARARIMGARYPYYLLADSPEGQRKEAEITRKAPSDAPTRGDVRQGFVDERVPHITLKSIANNAEIDVIWERWQETLEPLRDDLNARLDADWEEWQIPREASEDWPAEAVETHRLWWEARIARQQEIDASIAARADYEYLYDKPYEDNRKVRVAGPFTVESLSPHRVLAVDEEDELIDRAAEKWPDYGPQQDFAGMILEQLATAGVQQAHKEDRIAFAAVTPWPGGYICAEGRYREGDDDAGPEKRAGIFVGPEFGTVSRPDLVAAAREAGDAGFDVLIACAFNYEAHASEFNRLGRIPVLKARMNADLHMADELKNTGKGNLFVIFGEPDIDILPAGEEAADGTRIQVKINGVDVFHPTTGEVRSDGADGIACWFIDTDYNEESFFVRHAYFLGANDPYKALKTTLKAEIDADAWATLRSDISRPFDRPESGRIAVKVINHLGDEVMKVFRV